MLTEFKTDVYYFLNKLSSKLFRDKLLNSIQKELRGSVSHERREILTAYTKSCLDQNKNQ